MSQVTVLRETASKVTAVTTKRKVVPTYKPTVIKGKLQPNKEEVDLTTSLQGNDNSDEEKGMKLTIHTRSVN